jgi:hypothetical protein
MASFHFLWFALLGQQKNKSQRREIIKKALIKLFSSSLSSIASSSYEVSSTLLRDFLNEPYVVASK